MARLLRSIRDAQDCLFAAEQLLRGRVVGSYVRGVCGLWADGRNAAALDTLYRIKGVAREGRPLGTTLDGRLFLDLLDTERINASVHDLFGNARRLDDRLGSICFIRAPIHEVHGRALPPRLVSQSEDGTYWLQNWLPAGCRSTPVWMAAVQQVGLMLPVATSMNVSGRPELVSEADGIAFCREHQIPVFLADPRSVPGVMGSFPIIRVGGDGLTLLREGQFPARLMEGLLAEYTIDLSNYRAAKYPHVPLPEAILEGQVVRDALRLALIAALDG